LNKSLQLYKRMLEYVRPYSAFIALSMVLSIFIVTLDGMSIWLLGTLPKALFDPSHAVITQPELTFQTVNEWLKYFTFRVINSGVLSNPLLTACVLIVITFIFKNIVLYSNRLLLQTLNLKIIEVMRNKLYRHMLLLPMRYYDRNDSGKTIALLLNDVQQINLALTNVLSMMLTEPFRLLFFIGMLLMINLKLTLIVFSIYPLLAFIIIKFGQSIRRRIKRELESFSGLFSVLTETIASVRAVKMFNMHEAEGRRFEIENHTYVNRAMRSYKVNIALSPLTEVMATLVTACLLWYGGQQTLSGTSSFTAEDFFRFLFFLFASYQPFKTIGQINNTIQGGIAAGQRVFGLFDHEIEPLRSDVQPDKIPAFQQHVTFNQVSFTYPGTSEQVLKSITFTIPKGAIVALVGSSGAGKSTILDLVPRFYDVSGGSIAVDGTDIRSFDLAGLRHIFGIVSQSTILFNDTVNNNILYGNRNATKKQVLAAAQAAYAMEFIDKMPLGIDSVIGERGEMLSGGQRQRLAIARALLRNAPILVLDEATSSLDTESEQHVQRAIDNLIRNRTAIVVAHRLSTIRHADLILVLDKGEIVERGRHEELLAANGKYRHLYEIQFNVQPE
jgi:subfamily B ATP-binding cassette protein MsbA